VNVPKYIEWPLAQNFACRIVERLDGFSKVIEDRTKCQIQVGGRLPLADQQFFTKNSARCVLEISSRWAWEIPEVACVEPWLTRKMPEWHADENGRLCFEFKLKWEKELPAMVEQYGFGLIADYAATWLLNSTRSLLNRHLFAFRNGIKSWPKAWDYWPHGTIESARQLFENEQLIEVHA